MEAAEVQHGNRALLGCKLGCSSPTPPGPTCRPPPPLTYPGIGLLSRAAVHYMAADPQLATRDRSTSLAAAAEFRQMVAQLHEQGIEVLLQASCAPSWVAA